MADSFFDDYMPSSKPDIFLDRDLSYRDFSAMGHAPVESMLQAQEGGLPAQYEFVDAVPQSMGYHKKIAELDGKRYEVIENISVPDPEDPNHKLFGSPEVNFARQFNRSQIWRVLADNGLVKLVSNTYDIYGNQLKKSTKNKTIAVWVPEGQRRLVRSAQHGLEGLFPQLSDDVSENTELLDIRDVREAFDRYLLDHPELDRR